MCQSFPLDILPGWLYQGFWSYITMDLGYSEWRDTRSKLGTILHYFIALFVGIRVAMLRMYNWRRCQNCGIRGTYDSIIKIKLNVFTGSPNRFIPQLIERDWSLSNTEFNFPIETLIGNVRGDLNFNGG